MHQGADQVEEEEEGGRTEGQMGEKKGKQKKKRVPRQQRGLQRSIRLDQKKKENEKSGAGSRKGMTGGDGRRKSEVA